MPAQIGSLYVTLTMNSGPFVASMGRAKAATAQAAASIARESGIAQSAVNRLGRASAGQEFRPYALLAASRGFEAAADRASLLRASLLSTTAVLGGFGAALSANVISRYATTFVNLSNQLRTVTTDAANLEAVQDALVDVSERSRASLESTVRIYARTARATETLGTSQKDLVRITETVQKAFAIGGATAQEAEGAALQLSQAIASNRFSGDEFRSVAENAPVLLRGIAESLGVDIGKLRQFAREGKLTSEVVTQAILKASGRIDKEFSQTVITLDQSLTQLDNKLLIFIGSQDKAFGVTQLLSKGILDLGDNLDSIIPTLTTIAALMGTVFAVRSSRNVVLGGIGAVAGGIAGNAIGGPTGGTVGALLGASIGFLGGRGTSITDQNGERRQVSFFEAIRSKAEAAKDEVASLRAQEAELTKAVTTAEQEVVRARAAAGGDTLVLAPTRDTKAVAREQEALARAVREQTAGQEKLAQSYQRLNAITATMSPRAVRLADQQVAAEASLNAMLAKQTGVRAALSEATAKEAAAVDAVARSSVESGAAVQLAQARQATVATRQRIAAERDLAVAERQAADQENRIFNRRIKIAELSSAADQAAANKRIALQKRIADQIEKNRVIETAAAEQRARLSEAMGTGRLAGATIANNQLNAATTALEAQSLALATTTAQLGRMERAATLGGRALGLLRAAGAGIVGFFGGPFNLALFGAIAVFELLAAKSRHDAQEIADATAIVNQELQKLGKGGTGDQQAVADVLDRTILNKQKELETVQERINQLRGELEGGNFQETGVKLDFGVASAIPLSTVGKQALQFARDFVSSGEDVATFQSKIDELGGTLGAGRSAFDQWADTLVDRAVELKNAQTAVEGLKNEVQELTKAAQSPEAKALGGDFEQLGQQHTNVDLTNKLSDFVKLKAFNDEMQKQIALLKLSTDERSLAAAKQDYLNKAEKAGLDLTPALEAKAEAYAQQLVAAQKAQDGIKGLATALDKLNQQNDQTELDRLTAGFSDFNKELVKTLQQAGVATPVIKTLIADIALNKFDFSNLGEYRDKILEIIAALKQLQAAQQQVNSGRTTYSVPAAGGGRANVTVIRPTNGDAGSSSTNGGGGDASGPRVIDVSKYLSSGGAQGVSTFAPGGPVTGPGSGTSDSIPALLSNGEFVVNAEATRKNKDLLEAINSGRVGIDMPEGITAQLGVKPLRRYADGGPVFGDAGAVMSVSGPGHPPVAEEKKYHPQSIGEVINLLNRGVSLEDMDTIQTSGSTTTGTTTTTQFGFAPEEAESAPFVDDFVFGHASDPGLQGFDQAHPNWPQEAEQFAREWPGGPGFGYNPNLIMQQYRLEHADRFINPGLTGNDLLLYALAWATGHGLEEAFPDARTITANPDMPVFDTTREVKQALADNARLSRGGLVGFAGGGAIMPGSDSQVVQFAKSPEEMVAVMTPGQRKAVGDAMSGDINVTVTLPPGWQISNDPRLRERSRAEIRLAAREGVRAALRGR